MIDDNTVSGWPADVCVDPSMVGTDVCVDAASLLSKYRVRSVANTENLLILLNVVLHLPIYLLACLHSVRGKES